MNSVEYTHHARAKFEILKRYGFEVAPEQVEATVSYPEKVSPQPGERFIAQRTNSSRHVLRVVFRQQGETRVVITFYPGRRERYAD